MKMRVPPKHVAEGLMGDHDSRYQLGSDRFTIEILYKPVDGKLRKIAADRVGRIDGALSVSQGQIADAVDPAILPESNTRRTEASASDYTKGRDRIPYS